MHMLVAPFQNRFIRLGRLTPLEVDVPLRAGRFRNSKDVKLWRRESHHLSCEERTCILQPVFRRARCEPGFHGGITAKRKDLFCVTFGLDDEVMDVPLALEFVDDAYALRVFLYSPRSFSWVGVGGVP